VSDSTVTVQDLQRLALLARDLDDRHVMAGAWSCHVDETATVDAEVDAKVDTPTDTTVTDERGAPRR
jgi:hypothetical protein